MKKQETNIERENGANDDFHSEVKHLLQGFNACREQIHWDENLESKLQLILGKNLEDRWKYLPGLFLLNEHLLSTHSEESDEFKSQHRALFKNNFPKLAATNAFQLIFKNTDDQEQALAHLMVDLLIKNKSESQQASHIEIDQTFLKRESCDQAKAKLQTDLREAFSHIYKTLCENVGKSQAKSIFQNSYVNLADNYGLMPSFSFIVSILPEPVLTEQQLRMLTRTQIETVLIEKMTRLEQANARLTSEIKAKERIQTANTKNVQRLNQVIENAMDAVILMDGNGKVTFWNSQAESIFAWKPEEVIGQLLVDLIIPENQREEHLRSLNYHKTVGKHKSINRRIEEYGVTKHGQLIPLELSIVTNLVEGDLIYTIFIRDISDRNHAEKELMNAKIKAEQASVSKAHFLSTMSHEIRTPMNGLSGTIDFLLGENPRKDQIDSLKLMKNSCKSLLVILNDILDSSKIDEGHVEFDHREFSLREICQQVVSTHRQKAAEKSIELSLALAEQVPNMLMGDPVRLSQILNNLVSNAIKFTLHGQVTLKVQSLEDYDKKTRLKIIVEDTGIGIAKGNIDKIFDRFTQVHDQSHNTLSGTGLGLSISKKLLQLAGSDLIAESELGTGSTFAFEMSFEKAMVQKTVMTVQKNTPLELDDTRILIVEDNQINQIVASRFLKKWNCSVALADNGEQALDQLMGSEFDLILMDIQMPIMNGYQATEAIRQMPGVKDIPIIALTADVLPQVKEEALKVGMNDLMTKPFDSNKLYQIIAKNIA